MIARSFSPRVVRRGTSAGLTVLVLGCVLSAAGRAQDFVTLVPRVTPSVGFVLGRGADGQPVESGTAFAVAQGILVTALHVVAEADRLSVQFPGGDATPVDVAAIDAEHDIALLRLVSAPQPGPTPLAVGNSNALQLGEPVAVVGYPLPAPEHPTLTVTQGIISAIRTDPEYVQIDAPINPGTSGGPVITADGRVVGVVDASLRGAQNFNLAIPIDAVKPLLAHLPASARLTLPLTAPTQLFLTASGNDVGPHAHEEKEGSSCVDPPPHAAVLSGIAVTLNVQKPLHMAAWLSWDKGAPARSPGAFAGIDDSVAPELIHPFAHLGLKPGTVCLNYIVWNDSGTAPGRTFAIKYTLDYRVFDLRQAHPAPSGPPAPSGSRGATPTQNKHIVTQVQN